METNNFRSVITDTEDGVSIALSMKRNKRTSRTAFLWSIIWPITLPIFIAIALDFGNDLKIILFSLFWIIVGAAITVSMVKLTFGKELIVVTSETVSIGTRIFGFYFKRSYRRHDITELQAFWDDPFDVKRSAKVNYQFAPLGMIFTYQGDKKVQFGYGVSHEEARYLMDSVMKLSMNHQEFQHLA